MYKFAIVCIDDDPMITLLLNFQLSKIIDKNTTVVVTCTKSTEVEKNIEELIEIGIELVLFIVDYQMPDLNGADLIRKLKHKYPVTSCVMLSGQANELVLKELRVDNLLDNYIQKPWDELKLFEIVSRYLQ